MTTKMRTRISRTGQEQVILTVWLDLPVYNRLIKQAKAEGTTLAEHARTILARASKPRHGGPGELAKTIAEMIAMTPDGEELVITVPRTGPATIGKEASNERP